MEELCLAIKNQDEVMQVMIERCQTMELEANNLSHHVKDTLPTDLKVIEARIDQRCSALLEIKSDSDASKLVGLKTSFNTQLGSLKGKIDASEKFFLTPF